MTTQSIWELIGYLGSALVLVSLLMSSIIKLRVINALGSLIFCVYAFQIRSLPTAVMNAALVGIDLYFLYRLIADKTGFTCTEARADDAVVLHILEQYRADITKYFGEVDISAADQVIIIFDKATVAGVSAGISRGEELEFLLDYTTPQYRDCKVGKYLCGVLAGRYQTLSFAGEAPLHTPYLEKMGYEMQNGKYRKSL